MFDFQLLCSFGKLRQIPVYIAYPVFYNPFSVAVVAAEENGKFI